MFLLTVKNTRQGIEQVLSMLRDVRTAVDRLAQRVDGVETVSQQEAHQVPPRPPSPPYREAQPRPAAAPF